MARRKAALMAVVTAMVAMTAGACGGDKEGADGEKTLIVGVDLPMQGGQADASKATVNAMKLYLESIGGKAGKYKVQLKEYDNSTAAKGAWDEAKCKANANEHVTTTNEVAVMGTYNSGCAKLIAPVLNEDPNGPMLMVSHANTAVGLTKAWEPGEPKKYRPTGKLNYGRVVTTDDNQGTAAASFVVDDLKAKRCYVLHDNQTYGQGLAKAFVEAAKKKGCEIVGDEPWDSKQPTYTSLFNKIKGTNPDMVFLSGVVENNGVQLVKDKVAVLGDNDKVKLLLPDGFSGSPDLAKLKEAQGAYLTLAGLPTDELRKLGGEGAKLLDNYKKKYGADPATSYALYGVQALQVILAAIEKSDGTRKSVNEQIFSGAGLTVPGAQSMLGKDVKLDPATGDVVAKDISVLQMKEGKETFVKPLSFT